MRDFDLEGIMDRLTQLDDDLVAQYGYSCRFEMVIVGGSALIIMNLAPDSRFTTDIDVLTVSVEVEDLLARYDMNTDVSTFLYQYPENWNKRKRMTSFEGQVLDVYTLSNEDIAITKLLSWRDADKGDLLNMRNARNVDEEKLREILDDPTELQINLEEGDWVRLTERTEEFLSWRVK